MRKALLIASALLIGAFGLSISPAQAATGDPVWVANGGSTIIDKNTVKLTDGQTSVEAANLGLEVPYGVPMSFRPELGDGVKCSGGAPRVFVVISEKFYNTWDSNPDQCGQDDGLVTYIIPAAGTITQAGVVFDNGQSGEVLVHDLSIGGKKIDFKAIQTERLESIPAPVYTGPTCEKAGTVVAPTPLPKGIREYVISEPVDGKVTVTVKLKRGYLLPENWEPWTPYVVEKLSGDDCVKPTPTPTPDKPTPSPMPTPGGGNGNGGGGTPDPSPDAGQPIPPANNAGNELPVTGPNVRPLIVATSIGLGLISLGGILLAVAHRRRAVESA